MGLPYQFAGLERRPTRPLSPIGADGLAVLRESGFDEEDIAELVQGGIVSFKRA